VWDLGPHEHRVNSGDEPVEPSPFRLLTTLVSPGNFSRQANQKPTQRADPFRERNAGVSRSRR
jgi:hypothetical protein